MPQQPQTGGVSPTGCAAAAVADVEASKDESDGGPSPGVDMSTDGSVGEGALITCSIAWIYAAGTGFPPLASGSSVFRCSGKHMRTENP